MPGRKAEQQAVIAGPAKRQARQGASLDPRRNQPLHRRLISATALEAGDKLDASRGHLDREHPAQLSLQFLDEVIAAGVIEPAHPAQMREKMAVSNELGERLLDVT
ncbi:hypothetical protein ABIG06_004863 [Bradyrhizobium sp. USDA 326]